MHIPDHLTCLLRNLYAGQEATVRTGYEIIDWLQIGKGVCQGCMCHLFYLTYMQSTSCKMPGWMKQILINSLFIFILLQIFSNFACYRFLDTSIILKTFKIQIYGFFKSIFDNNFSF